MTFDRVAPVVPVRDLDAALDRYAKLGFTVHAYEGDERYGFVSRDRVELHLTEWDEHDPERTAATVYLYVADADAVHEEWTRASIEGRFHGPFDTPYGLREFAFVDVDGTLHRVGSPLARPADATTSVAVTLQRAELHDRPVLLRLLELYVYDFSELAGWDVDEHGEFGYQWLDHYWTDEDRHPFLVRAGDAIAGFALVMSGQPHDMAEFFVLRRHRRSGVGVAAARAVFDRFPGDWQVRQRVWNPAATAFWRRAIPVPFREERTDTHVVQRFAVEPA